MYAIINKHYMASSYSSSYFILYYYHAIITITTLNNILQYIAIYLWRGYGGDLKLLQYIWKGSLATILLQYIAIYNI